MSNAIKGIMVIGLLAVVAACAKKPAPAPAPAAAPMVAPEPTMSKK